jgi:hypothetical protein
MNPQYRLVTVACLVGGPLVDDRHLRERAMACADRLRDSLQQVSMTTVTTSDMIVVAPAPEQPAELGERLALRDCWRGWWSKLFGYWERHPDCPLPPDLLKAHLDLIT